MGHGPIHGEPSQEVGWSAVKADAVDPDHLDTAGRTELAPNMSVGRVGDTGHVLVRWAFPTCYRVLRFE